MRIYMANKKEIEIKLRIDDTKFYTGLISKMKSMCTEVEHVHQHDVYYSPATEDYMDESYPYKWLRLRYFNDGGAEICFKHFFPEGAEHHVYCNEYQSRISDPEALVNIFSELQLQEVANVKKTRTTYAYDRYLISFDDVENLGNFVEIEVKNVIFDELRERKLLDEMLEKLGLLECPIDLRGYPYLIYHDLK